MSSQVYVPFKRGWYAVRRESDVIELGPFPDQDALVHELREMRWYSDATHFVKYGTEDEALKFCEVTP